MFSSSIIELSQSALARNVRFLKKELGPGVVMSSVVKGNAYGHSISTFVPMAERCGLRHFSVFDASEALQVFQARTHKDTDIMIMGDVAGDALEWAIRNRVSFYVFDVERLEATLEKAGRIGMPARVHFELETGLNRTGLGGTQLDEAVEVARKHLDRLELEGVCTHFAGAESIANYKRIQDQIDLFNQHCARLERDGLRFRSRHTAASAAALIYPETRLDMARVGIAQFGFWPSKETEMRYVMSNMDQSKRHHVDPLRRVIRWSSRVMSIKKVQPGEFVGYGTSYLTTRPQKIATVPIGYFHGFRRSLSNLGRVLIRGRRAGIVGNVNMNLILVNVSEMPGVEIGDEVVLIGKQRRSQITISSFSDLSNLLNYEVLVRLPSDIPRVVVK